MSLPFLTWGNMPFALLSLFYVVGGAFCMTALYRLFFHPLANIPGPFLAKITRFWHTKQYASGQWHDISLELHQWYGPVVRIAPGEVSFVDAEALKKLYSYSKAARKTTWYDAWSPHKKTAGIFSIIDPKEHARRRRQVATAYSMTSVLGAEPLIQNVADVCWKQFHHMAAGDKSLDLDFWVTGFAYDVVGELAFGKSLKIMELGTDEGGIMEMILIAFKMMSTLASVPGQMAWFYNPIVSLLLKCFGENPMDKFTKIVNARIAERRERGTPERRDMLQQFLEAKTDQGLPLPFGELESEAFTIMGAGADTSSVAINAIIGCLIQDPHTTTRLQQEIDNYCEENSILDHCIEYNQCLDMPLLQAIIKEGLRLHPSIQFQLPRYAPPEGITIQSHYIPGGYAIGISPKSHNRSTEIFGKDANEWRPERWLEDEDRAKTMSSLVTTWGFGSRVCIGKNIALVEINKFIAQFLRQFDVSAVNKQQPFTLQTFWFATHKDFWVTLQERRLKTKV